MKNSQTTRLLERLNQGQSITCLQSFNEIGCTQLATRIKELKEEGVPIVSKWIKVKNRFGEDCHVKEYSIATDLKVAA